MPQITLDNRTYELDELSDEVKSQLANVRLCDTKILQLKQELALIQTARNTYAAAVSQLLPEG
ncbi:MAG: DUF6447 family protein [Marinobacterium sp.]|nr:DUF6447 family protein [Marinobacterium sp.]